MWEFAVPNKEQNISNVTMGKWVWDNTKQKTSLKQPLVPRLQNIMDVLGFTKDALKGPKRNRWEGKKG